MPALTLPLTFSNSFWSADYRKGLETLFTKLEQGVAENEEIVTFIRARAVAENDLANQLINPVRTGSFGTGFDADEGASLLMAFRGLQVESRSQGEAHKAVANELNTIVAGPFDEWARSHRNRIMSSRNTLVEDLLKSYELGQADVERLKTQYLSKVRRADEAEDDAKFAPNNELDKFTASPRLHPRDIRNPQRSASVSERIAARFKELQRKAASPTPDKPAETEASTEAAENTSIKSPSSEGGEKASPKVDKGKGKETVASPELHAARITSPPPMSPPLPEKLSIVQPASRPAQPLSPILLAGLAMSPSAVSDLLKRAATEMNLRPVKFPIIGEYKDCFSGEDLVVWLVDNVPGLGGSLDRAEDAAKDLTEREGVVRRIGEFGNAFENNDEAFYQFRTKAFNLEAEYALKHADQLESITSPVMANLTPMADNLVKRSGTLVNFVTKAINSQSEPKHIRTRVDADEADKAYRVAIRRLDRQRLGLEERIEETLKAAQKWEIDRLHAVKTVLSQYHATLTHLPNGMKPSYERTATLIASFQPESDMRALIETYRTGPFTPVAQVYESITHDEADVYFGIDLRRWAEGGWNAVRKGEEPKETVPEVLTALLRALTDKYPTLANDVEKRKTWIYEVPLVAVHHLRESLNGIPSGLPIPDEVLSKYDAPVLASTVKLWALELDPPLCLFEGWDEIRRIYPTGAKTQEPESHAQHIQDIQVALLRLPKIHLLVLQAWLGHIRQLIDSTTVEEDTDVYITKLALSMGRAILRPRQETQMTLQDRHATSLFFDLLKYFTEIIPPTIAKKKRDSERRMPIRKRTAPIDMRVSRSRLSVAIDPREVVEAQLAAKHPNMRAHSPAPPVPPLPTKPADEAPQSAVLQVPPPPPLLIPPPPPLLKPSPSQAAPESVPTSEEPAKSVADSSESASPMPAFNEPAPEKGDFDEPPRPNFAEPPPEEEESVPEVPPRFVSPPPEVDEATETTEAVGAPPVSADAPSAPVIVSPPTPRAAGSRSRSPTQSSTGSADGKSGASLSRSGSGEASRLRGPRGARSPRQTSSNNMPSMTAGLKRAGSPPQAGGLARSSAANRMSFGGRSPSPANPHDYEPRSKRGGRAQAGNFSRRTMASDAEDEVVNK